MSMRDRNSTPQRVLVTGARGKVGAATVAALAGAGHEVIATDLGRPTYDADGSNVRYVQADLTQPGDAFAIVRDVDAVVHAAGIPEPTRNVAHTVFLTNVAATFAVLEAATANRVPRVVNLSSDSVTGMTWAHAPFEGLRCPIDETHPELAHDAYGLSKRVGEMLCEAFVTRTGGSAVSVRPTWVLTADTYASNLRPFFDDPDLTSAVFWSYIDVDDLADLLLACVERPNGGHETVFAAAADNIGGRDLAKEMTRLHPGVPVAPLSRTDASGIDSGKAEALFGWSPRRSWRNYLDDKGNPLAAEATS